MNDNKSVGHKTSPDTEAMLAILEGKQFPTNRKDLFLAQDIESFFNELLSTKGMTKSEVILHSNIDSDYAYDILAGRCIAKRDYYLCLAVAMQLDKHTTQRMLAIVGTESLSLINRRDAAIVFALNHGYDCMQTDEFMAREKLRPLLNEAEPTEPNSCSDSDSRAGLDKGLTVFSDPEIKTFFDDLFSKTSMKKSEIISVCGLEEKASYIYEIFSGACMVSRDYYLCIAFGMKMDLQTTQRMLGVTKAGCLYPLVHRDAAIIYSINQGYDNKQVDEFLQELKLPSLQI